MDTIACSTPIAHSGIALIRMSGEKSIDIIHQLVQKELKHRQSTFRALRDKDKIIDTAWFVCLWLPAPTPARILLRFRVTEIL